MRALLAAPVVALTTLVIVLVGAPRPAHARCPQGGWPSKDACQTIDATFMPGLVGMGFFPKGADGKRTTWLGAGVQIVPFLWSHNTEKFGPGQGKLIFDIGELGSSRAGTGNMLMYRFGGQLSFERNASRNFAIPFFGVMFGGLDEKTIEHVGFFEATVGLHALFLKNVVLTFEGGYLFPFSKVDELAGIRATVAVNFTMW